MNERLRAAVAAAEQFDDQIQEQFAAVLEEEMAWEQSFADPRHDDALDQMEAEVLQHIAKGEVYEMPGDDA